jgi:glutamate-1-semialdehyde 2,1-aminomutase
MSRYSKSEAWLHRAELTIPLGSQTFSKSRTQYPVGISPLYIEKAKGSTVWDIDGNRYIDLVSSLASVTIGHSDRSLLKRIRRQLKKGVIFSLPGTLETEVAELVCELVPSAEMVRFGKNGTDATSAAVRLARAYTKKDHVAVCGYHGWQDWYIGSTSRHKGVPEAIRNLTHTFQFNNLNSLRNILESNNDVACIVMEPMNTSYPEQGFLEGVRELADANNVVLIFDETITGFRFAKGGAQELFNVTPDLSTFGKGIANGFPLSAVVGKRQIMMEMEEIFFSGTFGGELLSLAAAKHVLRKHKKNEVVNKLVEKGELLNNSVNEIIVENKLEKTLRLSGHPTWTFLNWTETNGFSQEEIKTLFYQEMFKRGILILNSHNVTTSLTKKNISKILKAYSETLAIVSKSIDYSTLRDDLVVTPLTPIFKVR